MTASPVEESRPEPSTAQQPQKQELKPNETEVAGMPFDKLVHNLKDPEFDRKAFLESLSREERQKLL